MMWLSFSTVFLQQCTWIVDSKVAITPRGPEPRLESAGKK